MKHERLIRELCADSIQDLKLCTKEERKLVFLWLIAHVVAVLGILFALIIYYQPLLLDLCNGDITDPFNLQNGWLLWAIIGIIVTYTGPPGATFATKYFSERWRQPKTNDSIDTVHEQGPLAGSLNFSILIWLVVVALVLPPLVEEYVYQGYLASFTKWLAAPIVVVICSLIVAFAHSNSDQLSHLFVGVLAFGLPYALTRNIMTSVAMHFLLIMVRFFVTFLPGARVPGRERKSRRKRKTRGIKKTIGISGTSDAENGVKDGSGKFGLKHAIQRHP